MCCCTYYSCTSDVWKPLCDLVTDEMYVNRRYTLTDSVVLIVHLATFSERKLSLADWQRYAAPTKNAGQYNRRSDDD